MQRWDLVRSRKLVSSRTSIPDAFEPMCQVSMGRAAPSSAETGKMVRRRRTKLRRFEVHRAISACFCDDCAEVYVRYGMCASQAWETSCTRMWMIGIDLPCCLAGTDEADTEAEADGEEPAARAGDAIEANGGAAQRIEVDERAGAWLADVEHDRATRADMIEQMLAGGHLYSPEEDSKVQELLAMFTTDSSQTRTVRQLKHGATVESSWTRLDEDGVLVGGTELVIHGASPLDINAFLMDLGSRCNTCRLNPKVDVQYGVREVRNPHYSVTFNEVKTAPFRNRTFLQAVLRKKLSETHFFWCTYPIANHSTVRPSDESHAVRAELVRCIRLTRLGHGATRVEYACSVDLKGRFPTQLTNAIVIPTLMGLPYVIQQYFLQIRRIDECTAQDGAFIGHMLMNAALSVKKARRAEVAATFISRTEMLRDAPAANLGPLLRSLVCCESHDLLAGDVATQDPAQLTAVDACTIANGITAICRGHVSTANAVAEVLDKYRVIRTMAEQCVWFEPMLGVVVLSLMAASVGTKLRLALSTALSMLDIGSDLSTMLVYFVTDQYLTGLLILAMMCFSIAAQSLLVFYRNKHRSAGEITKEVLIVLSCFKPVIDLRRQMDGREVDGAPFDTITERNFCKAIETVCESVPASIIAMVALLLIGKWAWAPIVSIVVSWITTAFKATSLTFTLDTDRKSRRKHPQYARTTCAPAHHRVAAPLVVRKNMQSASVRVRNCLCE
jgi:hypothetical protein